MNSGRFALSSIAIPAFCLLLQGCAASIQDVSSLNYVKEGFGQQALVDGGLAMLPVVAGQGQEGYRRPLADSIAVCISRRAPTVQFSPWQATMEKLNTASLADSYSSAIATYHQTSILDKRTMNSVGHAAGARFLLLVSLEDFSQRKHTTYNFFTGLESKTDAGVKAFAQVWDSQIGDVVWEGRGGAVSSAGDFEYTQPYAAFAQKVANSLTRLLLGSNQPPPKPGKWDRMTTR